MSSSNTIMVLCESNCPLTFILFFAWIAIPLDAALFPYSTASALEVIDDFNHQITLTTPVFLQGASYTTIYISENGMVTFDSNFYGGNTFPLRKKWIAPFGGDVTGYNGNLTQQTFDDRAGSAELTMASDLVDEMYSNDNFVATAVLVVTWYNVMTTTGGSEQNIFQLALTSDGSDKTYALFLYEQIQWYPAQIGASAGDSTTFLLVCNTNTNGATFLPTKSNSQCATPGVLVFRIDQSTWASAGYTCTHVYTPITCTRKPGNAEQNRDQRCPAR